MTGLALPAPSGLRYITGVRLWTPEMGRAARHGIIGVGFVIAVLTWLWALHFGSSTDSYAYWSVDMSDPWSAQVGAMGAFMYSPVAALIFAPFHSLPYPVFFVLWTTVLAVVALWLCPPILWAPGFVLLLRGDSPGQHSYPAGGGGSSLPHALGGWWALPILTKVTPGVGLVWHLARREWRELCLAFAVTAVLVAGSMVYSAGMWLDWAHFLLTNVSVPAGGPSMGLPFLPRLAVAAVVVLCAARSGRQWLVPLAVLMAMPVIWISGIPVFLIASVRLFRERPRRQLQSSAGASMRALSRQFPLSRRTG